MREACCLTCFHELWIRSDVPPAIVSPVTDAILVLGRRAVASKCWQHAAEHSCHDFRVELVPSNDGFPIVPWLCFSLRSWK